MIDISTETVVSPAEAARRLPARRAGKRPNIATIYRWMQIGCRGIRLECILIGGTRCTSLDRSSLASFGESIVAVRG